MRGVLYGNQGGRMPQQGRLAEGPANHHPLNGYVMMTELACCRGHQGILAHICQGLPSPDEWSGNRCTYKTTSSGGARPSYLNEHNQPAPLADSKDNNWTYNDSKQHINRQHL